MRTTAIIVIAAALALILISILKAPIKLLFKLILNTAVGFLALFAINYAGALFGVHLAVNWVNAVMIGVLGIPGAALVFLLSWAL
ncbi:MAG: pro-sigmaK processing inhibitor BofA family protein [Oscillospiraceae bacterium]|jgi:inhibitor of the pro-sigma K processing machinery|nr:pro-sigmaK processing inhibitor BofA family protein [Oscillospiraceae bacterium]